MFIHYQYIHNPYVDFTSHVCIITLGYITHFNTTIKFRQSLYQYENKYLLLITEPINLITKPHHIVYCFVGITFKYYTLLKQLFHCSIFYFRKVCFCSITSYIFAMNPMKSQVKSAW